MTGRLASKVAGAALVAALLVPEPATAQLTYQILHSFPAQSDGPREKLLEGSDGALYGICNTSNVTGNLPAVFALRPSPLGGFSLTILHFFDEGERPGSLIQAQDGDLYGTTQDNQSLGTIYKLSPAGVFTTLHAFSADGGQPSALVQGTDGSFYGTTQRGERGGTVCCGTVFKMNAAGTLTTLHAFNSRGDGTGDGEGVPPATGPPLIQAADGAFYGITVSEGPYSRSRIFRITSEGAFTILHTFSDRSGAVTDLVEGSDGALYGISSNYVGDLSMDEAFKITPSGSFTELHTFNRESEGYYSTTLIQASDGNFYATMQYTSDYDLGTAYRMTPAGDVTVLHSFTFDEGGTPSAGLIQAQNGLLYGSFHYGPVVNGGQNGNGSIFSMDTTGVLTTAYVFRPNNEGCGPLGGLVQAGDGAFYGTTYWGTVFRMTGDGTFTTLHSFDSSDGALPLAGLLQASDGNFYGTTKSGGAAGVGTVFRMTPAGVVTTLHHFAGSDGSSPWAPLIQASDGNLYGTTSRGGVPIGPEMPYGTLFKMSLSGTFESFWTFRTCHTCDNPIVPIGPLTEASDGRLYGTTYSQEGGARLYRVTLGGTFETILPQHYNHLTSGLTEGNDGYFYLTSFGRDVWPPVPGQPSGSVFKVTLEGDTTLLHTFNTNEGMRPYSAPIQASDGNFYGTTNRYAGAAGSIYRISPTGDFTTLKVLTDAEGAQPAARLLQASDGMIYGAALSGGPGTCGVIYRFTIP